MRLIKGLQRRRLMAIALLVAGVIVGAVAGWHASRLPAEASAAAASSNDKHLQRRLQRGVGSEVRFASAAKREQVDEAVGSAAEFIFRRSGLRMSDETRRQLVEAESKVLNREAKPTSADELADNITAAVVARLATITDEEIQQAAEVSSDDYGRVWSRANGKWGVLTKQTLIRQAQSGRDWSRRGDFALHAALRSMIVEEVSDRVSTLSIALPEQFGQTRAGGITPVQALLIAYSVATDDPLTDSPSDIMQKIVQQRMDTGQTRAQRKSQKTVSGRPYGPRGWLHPSAPHIFFNKAGIERLLSLSEGGEK